MSMPSLAVSGDPVKRTDRRRGGHVDPGVMALTAEIAATQTPALAEQVLLLQSLLDTEAHTLVLQRYYLAAAELARRAVAGRAAA